MRVFKDFTQILCLHKKIMSIGVHGELHQPLRCIIAKKCMIITIRLKCVSEIVVLP